jgi:SAM-dependent methyltransferase
MKDLVENRSRITLGTKLSLGWQAYRENGFIWCTLLAVYYATSSAAHRAFTAMDGRRRRKQLPGLNSRLMNKAIWEAWDWQRAGEEWTVSDAWKQSVVSGVLERYIPRGGLIVEVGPGGGRWTRPLLARADTYVGIDISAAAVEACAQQFKDDARAKFVAGSGQDLRPVLDGSARSIWSFDVFVHINRKEVELYADEFRRVLEPGGIVAIHHGGVGGAKGGWRSDLTAQDMRHLLEARGFTVMAAFSEWPDANVSQQLATYEDMITVAMKPQA